MTGDALFTYNAVTNPGDTDSLKLFPYLMPYIYMLRFIYRYFSNFQLSFTILNIFFHFISAYFIFKLLKKSMFQFTGLFVCIWLCNPFAVAFSVLGLNLTLFNTCLVIVLYLVTKFSAIGNMSWKNSVVYSLLLGGAMAIANAVRPIMIIFVIAILLSTLLTMATVRKWDLLKKGVLSICLIWIAFSFSFKWINQYMYSTIHSAVVENGSGWSLYVGSNYKYSGTWNQEDADYFKEKQKKNQDSSSVMKELKEEAIDRYLRYDTKQKLLLPIKKFVRLVGFARTPYNLHAYSFIAGINKYIQPIFMYFAWGLLAVSLLKSMRLFKSKDTIGFYDLFLLLSFIGLILAFLLVEVSNRYFIPMMVLLMFYSADELDRICKRYVAKQGAN